jgi:hypothetical protein
MFHGYCIHLGYYGCIGYHGYQAGYRCVLTDVSLVWTALYGQPYMATSV